MTKMAPSKAFFRTVVMFVSIKDGEEGTRGNVQAEKNTAGVPVQQSLAVEQRLGGARRKGD